MECPNCHDANSDGAYEGPACEVCGGTGSVPSPADSVLGTAIYSANSLALENDLLRKRIEKLEAAMRELNPGFDI